MSNRLIAFQVTSFKDKSLDKLINFLNGIYPHRFYVELQVFSKYKNDKYLAIKEVGNMGKCYAVLLNNWVVIDLSTSNFNLIITNDFSEFTR